VIKRSKAFDDLRFHVARIHRRKLCHTNFLSVIGSPAREYAMCHSDQAIGAMYEASLRYVCRSSARQGPTYAAR